MRTPVSTAPEIITLRSDPTIVEQVRHYSVITPLYGGGVKPAYADPVSVVRGTEIRGHLRFWWRATRGGVADGDLTHLWEEEGKIWGTAAGEGKPGPSPVQLALRVETEGHLVTPFRVERGRPVEDPNNGVPAYAAFPLQPTQDEIRARVPFKQVRKDVTFMLTLRYPKTIAYEVEAALWAWETFGGIGARTRRGFGALQCTAVDGIKQKAPKTNQLRQTLQAGLQKFVTTGVWPADVPHLQRDLPFSFFVDQNAGAAWQALIKKLRAFRQARKDKAQGQSLWPEPEAVYDLLRRPAKRPRPLRIVRSFPRAQFGLPIQFEFPQHKDGPGKSILHGPGKLQDRLSSPLILRPIACDDGAVGLAAILAAPRFLPDGLVLEETTTGKRVGVTAEISVPDAKAVAPLNGETNVLQAFLNYLNRR